MIFILSKFWKNQVRSSHLHLLFAIKIVSKQLCSDDNAGNECNTDCFGSTAALEESHHLGLALGNFELINFCCKIISY